jgi:hypothetical protein
MDEGRRAAEHREATRGGSSTYPGWRPTGRAAP